MILFLWKERNSQIGMLPDLVLYSDPACLSNTGGFTPLFISPPGRGRASLLPLATFQTTRMPSSQGPQLCSRPCHPAMPPVCRHRGHGIHRQPGFWLIVFLSTPASLLIPGDFRADRMAPRCPLLSASWPGGQHALLPLPLSHRRH